MPREQSVAPKERINVTFKPATGDAQEQVELPLKLLMIGDYTLQPDKTRIEDRELPQGGVTKDTFESVMASKNLALDLNVRNRLTGDENAELEAHLEFRKMADFSPDQIVKQVPKLQELIEIRNALTTLKGPLGSVPAFRKTLERILSSEEGEDDRNRLLRELGLEEGGSE